MGNRRANDLSRLRRRANHPMPTIDLASAIRPSSTAPRASGSVSHDGSSLVLVSIGLGGRRP